jgi:GLPGLI family protein
MKTITLIIIFTLQLQAQEKINYNLKINYNINYNTEIPNTKKGILYIDEHFDKSLFIYGKKQDKNIKIEEDDTSITYKSSQSVRFNYYNQKNDTLLSKDKIFKNEFVIKEKTPNFKWKLINKEKKIDSVLVRKAALNFRGRNYIAWYSTKYPIKFGPWKFNNLPGLIIEIYDETKRYHWVVTSIEKSKNIKTINLDLLLQKSKQISIKEFVDRRYNQDIPIFSDTRLPRGTVIMSREKSKRIRNGIEILFEWEEEKKK